MTDYPMKEWRREFDKEFVRDDGLMNKYGYDKNGESETTAELIKSFIEKVEAEAYARGLKDGKKDND